jgi:hypothetical protein
MNVLFNVFLWAIVVKVKFNILSYIFFDNLKAGPLEQSILGHAEYSRMFKS